MNQKPQKLKDTKRHYENNFVKICVFTFLWTYSPKNFI